MSGKGWIGVDLDGTLLVYDKWVGWNVFGAPIEPMVARVRQWLQEGKEVRIFTARVRPFDPRTDDIKTNRCRVTGEPFSNRMMISAVQAEVERHVGKRLFVTCVKDADMIELWDDRCIQVIPNTGRTLAEEHEAQYNVLRGKTFQGFQTCEKCITKLSCVAEQHCDRTHNGYR